MKIPNGWLCSPRPDGLLLVALIATACDAARPAEFQVRLTNSPLGSEATQEQVGRVLEQRAAAAGMGSASVKWTGGTTCTVRFARVQDLATATHLIETQGIVEWRWVDMDNRFREALPTVDQSLIEAAVITIESAAQPSVVQQLLGPVGGGGGDSITADSALRLDRPGPLGTLLINGAIPGEFLVSEEDFSRVDSLIQTAEVQRAVPGGLELMWAMQPVSQEARSYRPLYAVERRAVLTREQLQDATANIDTESKQAVVLFTLTRAGGRRFSEDTRRHLNGYLAIVLDGRVFQQPPVIRSEIGRYGQVELGSASVQDAQDLALVLTAGALPVPLTVVAAAWVGR
jgi:preprotein translocase subunit SecD